jgi:hypothetical protein
VGTVTGSVTVALTGASAFGEVDSVVYGQPLTGVSASGAVGTLVAGFGVGGAQADGSVGTLASNRTVALIGTASSASAGTMTGEAIYYASISGNSLTGNVQSISIGQRLVAVTGCPAMGVLGNFEGAYWSLIVPNQTPNWGDISDVQVPNWEVVHDF